MLSGSSSAPATIESLQAALAKRDAELAKKEEELAQLKAALNQKDAALAERGATLSRQASQIAKMKEMVLESLPEELTEELGGAILREDVEQINRLLVDEGLQFVVDDITLNDGLTPLSWACYNDCPKAVEALLAKGADAETKDSDGSTPLHHAASDCLSVVRMLLAKGASVEAVNENGNRPLHLAATVETAQALVQAGADLNPRNKAGQTPLMTARGIGRSHVVQFLLDQPGTDIGARDGGGRGVIHHAATSNSEKVMEAVLAHPGVDITAVDHDGNTALHAAAEDSSGKVVKLLLPHFNDIDVKNNDGRTPLQAAATNHSTSAVVALLEGGAEIKRSFEEQLLGILRYFFVNLYRNPTNPFPSYRRTLRWAMTSRVVEAALPSIRADAAAAAASALIWTGAGSTAALPADIQDTKTLRLPRLREEAWKRRGHLVFDRAMTIREAEKEGEA